MRKLTEHPPHRKSERYKQDGTEKCLPQCLAHAKCSIIGSYLLGWWKK